MIDKKEIVDKKMDDKNGDNSQINGKEPEESKTEEVAKWENSSRPARYRESIQART